MTYSVDRIHILSPFVFLAFDPVSVEISKETIDVGSSSSVSFPFFRVIVQEWFVWEILSFLFVWKGTLEIGQQSERYWVWGFRWGEGRMTYSSYILQVRHKVRIEMFVQIWSHKIRSTYRKIAGISLQLTPNIVGQPRVVLTRESRPERRAQNQHSLLPPVLPKASPPLVLFILDEVQ